MSEMGYRELSSWARLVTDGDKIAVELQIETHVRDKEHLRLLVAEVLRAAARADHEISCLEPEAVAERLRALDNRGAPVQSMRPDTDEEAASMDREDD